MIKKNTKIIFEDKSGKSEELVGGVPLSKGETVKVYGEGSNEPVEYEVVEKETEFFLKDKDQTANIIYTLKKKGKG